MLRRGRTTAGAVTFSLAVLVGAAGCSGVSVETPDGTVQIDADDDGDFSIEGEDGTKIQGGTRLPDDFPDDIPLVDGQVIQATSASSADGGGFSASLEVSGGVEDAYESASDLLVGAGFTDEGTQSVAGMSTGSFLSTDWQVLLTVSESADDDVAYVSYIVAPPSS